MKYIKPLPPTDHDISYKINSKGVRMGILESKIAKRFDDLDLWHNVRSKDRRLMFLRGPLEDYHFELFYGDSFYNHTLFGDIQAIRKKKLDDIFMITATPVRTQITLTINTFEKLLRGYHYSVAHRSVCDDPDRVDEHPGVAHITI